MHQKATLPKPVSAPVTTTAVTGPLSPSSPKAPAEFIPYAKVRKLLEDNRLDEAAALARTRYDAPMKNALGVCLMRQGRPEEAVRIYRGFVLDNTGLFLREQLPTVYKTNYALALMLSGRVTGGLNILTELAGDEHPSVETLRQVAARWKAGLSIFQKLALLVGLDVNQPVALDFPPGELLDAPSAV